jgi:class 3 adenylate cyclase
MADVRSRPERDPARVTTESAAMALPSGTVTFLLTDVEGSTRAWEADSTGMSVAMARHDEILVGAIARHGGDRPVEQGEGEVSSPRSTDPRRPWRPRSTRSGSWRGRGPTTPSSGMTNPQIAEKLFVSRSTVKTHLSHVFAKLGVSTRSELAGIAARRDA